MRLLGDSSVDIVIPALVFFPWMVAPLDVTQIGPRAFESTRITSTLIPRHVQILCSSCFSDCKSISSISFETESELIHIDSKAFHNCSSLKSITIPHHFQILCSSCFSHCNSLSSISFETESELTRIGAGAFVVHLCRQLLRRRIHRLLLAMHFRANVLSHMVGADAELSGGCLSLAEAMDCSEK
jgi:hypothetical protein